MFRMVSRLPTIDGFSSLIRCGQIGPVSRADIRSGIGLTFPRKLPRGRSVTVSADEKDSNAPLSVFSKYKVFKDKDSTIILDSTEINKDEPVVEEFDEFEGINLNRGVNGVYEIEELVVILRKENAGNIFVAAVPVEHKFVDYICIVTARSTRHMSAIAEFVRKLFKRKRSERDGIPNIEGKHSKDWMALDLGNIALHIFSENARQIYDLEQLWSVGPNFDSECNQPKTDILSLLESHSLHLHDLKPAEK